MVYSVLNIPKGTVLKIDSDFSPFKKSAIMKTMYEYYGEDKVLPISTVGTEGSKSAIGSSGRGLNNIQKDIDGTEYVDLETMQKIADLIPVDRGEAWAISDCIFGNEEKNRDPIRLLQNYYKTYPKLFDYAIQMEGLVNKRSQHASGVIIYPDDYNNYNSMMKTPSQERVTGLTMSDSEQRGGIKIDILYTEYQGVLQLCLELMRDDGIIQAKNAREMMKFIHPDNIDLDDKKVYETIFHTGNTDNIFQFDTDIGKGICAKLKPNNIVELATANSLMRLKSDFNLSFISRDFEGVEVTDEMKKAFEHEQLADKYLRYKNNINEVYHDMEAFYIRPETQKRIMKTLEKTYGVCVSQEDLMRTTMEFAGFDLGGANKARKIVAKKKLNDVAKLLVEFREGCLNQGLTIYEAFYCWLLLYGQLAYSFNDAHTYSYSIQGYQGAWLKTYYPIYWATACLSVDAQAIEKDEEDNGKNKTTDYAQIAKAIFKIRNTGIKVEPPLINTSRFDFTPDVKNNLILYGLKALNGVSDSIAQQIIQNRPYKDFDDFLVKNVTSTSDEDGKLGSKAMLSLIFSNSFRDIEPKRSECIKKYMNTCFNDVEKLTTRYLADIRKVKFLPLEFENMEEINKKMTVLKKYQNPENKKTWKVPREDVNLIQHIYDFYEDCIVEDNGDYILIEKKTANQKFKEAKEKLDTWLQENESLIKEKLNASRMAKQYKEWTKEKSPADIEFQSLGMYLSNNWLDTAKDDYGVSDFNELIYGEENIKSWGKYKGTEYPIFNISQIPVTVIEKNTKHKTITCLTKNKIITCKMKTEIFDFYSQHFTRGTKLIIWGYRTNDDTFTIKLYGSVKKEVGDTHTIIPI